MRPKWSPIYSDAFGWGRMTTVSMPIYKDNLLLGVTSTDIPIS